MENRLGSLGLRPALLHRLLGSGPEVKSWAAGERVPDPSLGSPHDRGSSAHRRAPQPAAGPLFPTWLALPTAAPGSLSYDFLLNPLHVTPISSTLRNNPPLGTDAADRTF